MDNLDSVFVGYTQTEISIMKIDYVDKCDDE